MYASNLCARCGGDKERDHKVRASGGALCLMGADGHLFESMIFPLRVPSPAAAALHGSGGTPTPKLEAKMLDWFKKVDVKTLSLEELVFAVAVGQLYVDTFLRIGIDRSVWEWAEDRLHVMERTIKTREIEEMERRLVAAEEEEKRLRTTEEKRGSLRTEIDALKQRMAAVRHR